MPAVRRGVVHESRLSFLYMFGCSPTDRHVDEDGRLLPGVTFEWLREETRRRDTSVEDCFTALRAIARAGNEPLYRQCLVELLEDDFADVRHLAFQGLYWDVKFGRWSQIHNGDEALRARIVSCCRRPATPFERYVGLRTRLADGDADAASEVETLSPRDVVAGADMGWDEDVTTARGGRRVAELREAAASATRPPATETRGS